MNTKILAVCHSKKYLKGEKIDNKIRDIKIYNEHFDKCIVHTNDTEGIKGDILIDLSKQEFTEYYLNQKFIKYNFIYMINCPYNLYIYNDNFNIILFKNICNLLDKNGILMFKISNEAIETILKVKTYDLLYLEEEPEKTDGTLLTEDEIKKINTEILNERKIYLNEIRKIITTFFEYNNIPLKLINIEDNDQYISDVNITEDYYLSSLYNFFVFKKINYLTKSDIKYYIKSNSLKRRLLRKY